jgi:hypothetical protein
MKCGTCAAWLQNAASVWMFEVPTEDIVSAELKADPREGHRFVTVIDAKLDISSEFVTTGQRGHGPAASRTRRRKAPHTAVFD